MKPLADPCLTGTTNVNAYRDFMARIAIRSLTLVMAILVPIMHSAKSLKLADSRKPI